MFIHVLDDLFLILLETITTCIIPSSNYHFNHSLDHLQFHRTTDTFLKEAAQSTYITSHFYIISSSAHTLEKSHQALLEITPNSSKNIASYQLFLRTRSLSSNHSLRLFQLIRFASLKTRWNQLGELKKRWASKRYSSERLTYDTPLLYHECLHDTSHLFYIYFLEFNSI